MSIIQKKSKDYWSSNRETMEFDYFDMGFDKAIEIIGNCICCEHKNTIKCPIGSFINKVDLETFYCAYFVSKVIE